MNQHMRYKSGKPCKILSSYLEAISRPQKRKGEPKNSWHSYWDEDTEMDFGEAELSRICRQSTREKNIVLRKRSINLCHGYLEYLAGHYSLQVEGKMLWVQERTTTTKKDQLLGYLSGIFPRVQKGLRIAWSYEQ